jgi:hypothetical protein
MYEPIDHRWLAPTNSSLRRPRQPRSSGPIPELEMPMSLDNADAVIDALPRYPLPRLYIKPYRRTEEEQSHKAQPESVQCLIWGPREH